MDMFQRSSQFWAVLVHAARGQQIVFYSDLAKRRMYLNTPKPKYWAISTSIANKENCPSCQQLLLNKGQVGEHRKNSTKTSQQPTLKFSHSTGLPMVRLQFVTLRKREKKQKGLKLR